MLDNIGEIDGCINSGHSLLFREAEFEAVYCLISAFEEGPDWGFLHPDIQKDLIDFRAKIGRAMVLMNANNISQ